jgi:hypothetical protein
MKLTIEQKISVIIPLANLLVEFIEDVENDVPKAFRHELKRSAKNFINEALKQNNGVLLFQTEQQKDQVAINTHEVQVHLKKAISKIKCAKLL